MSWLIFFFLCKGPDSKFCLVEHTVSVTAPQLCYGGTETATHAWLTNECGYVSTELNANQH